MFPSLRFQAIVACLLFFVLGIRAAPPKQPPKDDLPDVALEIPAEARPEVQAVITSNVRLLRSQKVSDRLRAVESLGELKDQGMSVRGHLCRSMLDQHPRVRVGAADALKKIDPRMHYLAVALITEENVQKKFDLLTKIQNLKEDAAPLIPLVAKDALVCAVNSTVVSKDHLRAAENLALDITTLGSIARNDYQMFQFILSALSNPHDQVRHSAIRALAQMKNGRLAVPRLIAFLKSSNRPTEIVDTIQTLATLADSSNEEIITPTVQNYRYHKTEAVRKTVDEALNTIKNKQKP